MTVKQLEERYKILNGKDVNLCIKCDLEHFLRIVGDENLAEILRASTAAVLFLNAEKYGNHERSENILRHPDAN